MDFRKRTITVRGTEVEFDCDESGLPIADLNEDMEKVAAQMGYWGSVLASAEGEKIDTDAYYRHWRATKSQAVLLSDPKAAEWKIKQACEADEQFLKLKKAIGMAEENVVLAKSVFEAFGKKANVLQSRGARERDEIGAQNLRTPEKPTTPPPRMRKASVSEGSNGDTEKVSVDRATAHLRSINKGRKAVEV